MKKSLRIVKLNQIWKLKIMKNYPNKLIILKKISKLIIIKLIWSKNQRNKFIKMLKIVFKQDKKKNNIREYLMIFVIKCKKIAKIYNKKEKI